MSAKCGTDWRVTGRILAADDPDRSPAPRNDDYHEYLRKQALAQQQAMQQASAGAPVPSCPTCGITHHAGNCSGRAYSHQPATAAINPDMQIAQELTVKRLPLLTIDKPEDFLAILGDLSASVRQAIRSGRVKRSDLPPGYRDLWDTLELLT